MKILIIPSWYPNRNNDSVGSFYREQAALLSENGYEIKILFGNRIPVNRFDYLKHKIKRKIGGVKPVLGQDFCLQQPTAFSFTVYQSKIWKDEKKYYSLCYEYERAFQQLMDIGWKPDLIHAQTTVDAGLVAAHLSRVFKIPFVIIEHQVFLLNCHSQFKQELIVNALQRANKVGAVSNHQKRCILMNDIRCNPVVVWNFVDEDKFKIGSKKSVSKFRILTISYSSYIKDMDTFFKSIESFCKSGNEEVEVVVIGNASFDNLKNAESVEFENLARKYNVHSKCIFLPNLPRNEVAEILNTAHVFVSTSIAETFGVAVREAMLCGVPVVVTASGGVEDTVNEKTGVKVDIGDYNAIAGSIAKIKNKDLQFDPVFVRNYVISQCGKAAFLASMKSFYTLSI